MSDYTDILEHAVPDLSVEEPLFALPGELEVPLLRCGRGYSSETALVAPLRAPEGAPGIPLEELERRYQRALELSAIRDPGILPVLQSSPPSSQHPYVAWDLPPGETLRSRLARTQPTTAWAARLMRRLAVSVAALHAHDLIHGSLVPANVLVSHDATPYLLAPGLESSLLSNAGLHVAARYRAPEQLPAGNGKLSKASDVFALGLLLFELIDEQPPFLARDLDALYKEMTQGPEPEPTNIPAAALPLPLKDILDRALAVEPAQRFADAHELSEQLDRLLALLEPRRVARQVTPTIGVASASSVSALTSAASAPRPAASENPVWHGPLERLHERRREWAQLDAGPPVAVWLVPTLVVLALAAALAWWLLR